MFAALASTWIYKLIAKLVKNPLMLVLVLAVVGLSFNQGRTYYNDFMVEYQRLNSEKQEKENDTSANWISR
jgi:hypothetical protein